MTTARFRRGGLAAALIALVAALVTVATPSVAHAGTCDGSYVTVIQSNWNGSSLGPSINTHYYPNPSGEFSISNSSPTVKYVTHTGQIRPRRAATFKYVSYATGTTVYRHFHTTQASRDNGVIHHEPEVRFYSWGVVGETLYVYADFETRYCGTIYNAYLGNITLVP